MAVETFVITKDCVSLMMLTQLFAGLQVKELKEGASGTAFQVILSPSNTNEAKVKVLLSPEKKEISLEDQKKKLVEAEQRRKVQDASLDG